MVYTPPNSLLLITPSFSPLFTPLNYDSQVPPQCPDKLLWIGALRGVHGRWIKEAGCHNQNAPSLTHEHMTTEIQTTTDMPGVQSEDDFEMLMNELDDPSNGWSDALPVQEDPPTHVVDTIIATKPETDMPPTEDQKLAKQRFDTFTSDAVQEVNTTFQRMCVSGEGNLINAGAAEIAGLKFLAGNKDELLVFMAAYDMRKYIFTKKDD